MTWRNVRRRHVSLQIFRQMHHHWLHRNARRVEDMYLLLRTVAAVHVIELHVVAVRLYAAQHEVIVAAVVDHLAHHAATHTQQERLVVALVVYAHEFVEMAHCGSIVRDAYRELLAGCYRFTRECHVGAAATGAHIGDAHGLVRLVLHFKVESGRCLIQHLSAVDYLVRRYNALRHGSEERQCKQRYAYKYLLHTYVLLFQSVCYLFYSTLSATALVRAPNSGL